VRCTKEGGFKMQTSASISRNLSEILGEVQPLDWSELIILHDVVPEPPSCDQCRKEFNRGGWEVPPLHDFAFCSRECAEKFKEQLISRQSTPNQ